MAIIQGNAVSAGGFYPKELEQSLRFDSASSAYLSWTPASAGNSQTFTFSAWIKRGNIVGTGNRQTIFGVNSNTIGTQGFTIAWSSNTDDALVVSIEDGTHFSFCETSAVFRDPSAWYHLVVAIDVTQATGTDRVKIYVNGELLSYSYIFASGAPVQNTNTFVNQVRQHNIGVRQRATSTLDEYNDGYLAETHFIDGTAYTASDFGEFKNGVWIPKAFAGTYGTNGFYLPYNNDYTVEGFSATTYQGTGVDGTYIGGVGFEPDLIWIKNRVDGTNWHALQDTVRGTTNTLWSNSTAQEVNNPTYVQSVEADGFVIGTDTSINGSGEGIVAWCWDAGTGSPASNTDGTITSTVKASTTYGFSIVSYTGTGAAASVGHGLSQAPELMIYKRRDIATNWSVLQTFETGSMRYGYLNLTNVFANASQASPTSTIMNLNTDGDSNASGGTYIAYCFHSVAGYSDLGSYTGTGAAGNVVTTGFRPAFVMVKRATGGTGDWIMLDSTRNPTDSFHSSLSANSSSAEFQSGVGTLINVTATGFTVDDTGTQVNNSGDTYIYMAFADTREAAFWLDQSGNNNDWENNGLTESDISLDSPTNNFATLNSIKKGLDSTYSEGNLKVSYGSSSSVSGDFATIGMTSGKWYWEWAPTGGTAPVNSVVGIVNTTENSSVSSGIGYYPSYTTNGWAYTGFDGNKQNGAGTSTAYGATFTSTDIVGVAFDADAGELEFYKNGVSQGVAYTGLSSDTYYPAFGDGSELNTVIGVANFGQDSSFAGNKVAQGNTDANGRGDFYYAPPAGYLALCTANLPEPAIGPNSATTADEHFNTVLYTGNGSTQSITGVGFQPDFVWGKMRSQAFGHRLYDAVRGATNKLATDSTSNEVVESGLTSFDSDGFSLGSVAGMNSLNDTFVAWNWKANNTAGSTNTNGSITSTVSANVDAGFSIVSYTGTGSAGTVGHGLNSKPDLLIVKMRTDAGQEWAVYDSVNGATKWLKLNNTDASSTLNAATVWNNTEPTSSVFTVGSAGVTNLSAKQYIAYCFHSVPQLSKCFSYTGNGSADGSFVFTDFEPAFILLKRTDTTGNWTIIDTEREGYNVDNDPLYPNLSNAEGTTDLADILSNGFKLRTTDASVNASGGTYIGYAVAKNPLKYGVAR